MYVIQHKQNKSYYKSKITKEIKHFVLDIKSAKKIQSKVTARNILNSFNKPENFEIIKLNKKGVIMSG